LTIQPPALLWPEEHLPEVSGQVSNAEGPNTELAVILLASGCTLAYVRAQCGFESLRAVTAFARDGEVARAVAEQSRLRADRVGTRALVRLEQLLAEQHTDLRATVLAVRTGLEVGGILKRDAAQPVKTVRELSVPELNQLIESTRAELDSRIASRGR
jgi:hypothetical protein